MFDFFWDRPAGLLIASCVLPQHAGFALVLVSRTGSAHGEEPVAVVPVLSCDRNVDTTFAIPVGDGDKPQSFLFRLVIDGLDGGETPMSDHVVLDASGAGAARLAPSLNWSVHASDQGPQIVLAPGADGLAAETRISRVFESRRDGQRLLPATAGDGLADGMDVEVETAWRRAGEVPEAGGDDVLLVDLRAADNKDGPAARTSFRAFSLIAASQASSLIERPDDLFDPETCNFGELRLDPRTPTAQARFPRSSTAHDPASFALGLLDRVVVQSHPPARFVLRTSTDQKRIVGRDGSLVLAVGHDGAMHADEGLLLQRVIGLNTPQAQADVDFIAGLAQMNIVASRADLDTATEVSLALAAETAARVGARLPALRPAGLAQFRLAPQFLACLCRLGRDQLPGHLAARLARSAHLDANGRAGLLGRLLLERQLEAEDDRRGRATDINRLRLWLDSDPREGFVVLAVALSPALQELVQGGILPEWETIDLLTQEPPPYLYDLGHTLDRLTRADVLPFTAEAQFCTLSDSGKTLRTLRSVRTEVIAFVDEMNAALGYPLDLSDHEDSIIDLLVDTREHGGVGLLPLQHGLERHLHQKLPDTLASRVRPPFLRRVGRMLSPGLRTHFRHVTNFVAAGFANPVPMPSPGPGAAEPQPGLSAAPVPAESVDWVMSDAAVPDLVAGWRRQLRREYEERARRH